MATTASLNKRAKTTTANNRLENLIRRSTTFFPNPPRIPTSELISVINTTASSSFPTTAAAAATSPNPHNASQQDQSFILVDVRTRDEYNVSHLPNALHLSQHTPSNILSTIQQNKTDTTNIVFYCTTGMRSSVEAHRFQRLLNQPQANAQPLAENDNKCLVWNSDGILKYVQDGGKVVRNGKGVEGEGDGKEVATRKVHVFEKGLKKFVEEGWEAVWFDRRRLALEVCPSLWKIVVELLASLKWWIGKLFWRQGGRKGGRQQPSNSRCLEAF